MTLISGKTDFREIEAYFENLAGNYVSTKKTILKKFQKILLVSMRRVAPRKSGDYADSWKLGPITDDSASIITSMGDLFILLEKGAGPQKRSRKPPQKPYVFKGKDGKTVFTFKVDWPGFAAIPHAQIALDLALAELEGLLNQELGLLLSGKIIIFR